MQNYVLPLFSVEAVEQDASTCLSSVQQSAKTPQQHVSACHMHKVLLTLHHLAAISTDVHKTLGLHVTFQAACRI